MARTKKASLSTRGTSAIKAVSSAQKTAVQALAGWGRTVRRAVATTERGLSAATRKTARIKARSGVALDRIRHAKAAPVKAAARAARNRLLVELAAARRILTAARESYAAAKAAQQLFRTIEKGMASGVKEAEKAARPKRLRSGSGN